MRWEGCAALILVLGFGLGTLACHRDTGPQPAAEAPAPSAAAPAPAPAQGGDTAQAPTGILYSTDPAVYSKGVAIAPNIPYVSGGVARSFQVRPPLPGGLSLDVSTGVISGTPTAMSPAKVYQVTAANPAGTCTRDVSITVNDQPPDQTPVVTIAPFLSAGDAQSASTQDQGPGTTYTWTLTGADIGSGQGTPAIKFTAGAPGPLTAEVKVSTTGGTASGRAEATVVPMPDASLTFTTMAKVGSPSIRASVPSQTGMTYTWTVIPGTGTATIASGQGTSTVECTAANSPGTFQLDVQVRSQAGKVASARGTVTIR